MLVQNFLENSATHLPDKVALVCGDQRLTYRKINHSADQFALALVDMGVTRQDRVIVFLDNSVESVISIFGILKAGAIFIVLNSAMKPKKLTYILKDSGARAIITHINKRAIIAEAINDSLDLKNIIWIGNTKTLPIIQDSSIKNIKWDEVLFKSGAPNLLAPSTLIDMDLATIIYTSGSTGEPKGVMCAHNNMIAAAQSITSYLENVEEDIILNLLPLSFDYGLYQILMTFMIGGTVILEKFVYPEKSLEVIAHEHVTGFPIVPTIAAILLNLENLSKYEFSSVRYISSTAAAFPVTHIRKLQVTFPSVKIFSMYGLTECKRVSYLPPDQLDRRTDSVGIPMPNVEIFIVDEKGHEVGSNEIGELIVRGSNVMRGYWNSPEETSKTFQVNKNLGETHLHSGDLFEKDEDGFLYFVSRKDNMIKSRGELLSPKEVEKVLYEIEEVQEAVVVGVPDEILGQAIKAVIVKNKNANLREKRVKAYCSENLESFMIPKYVEFTNNLVKLPNGKIDIKKIV